MFLGPSIEIPRSLSDIASFTEAIEFVYYTTFVYIWYRIFQLHFQYCFRNNYSSRIYLIVCIYVVYVKTFSLFSYTRDISPIYGSLKTAGIFSGPYILALFRLLSRNSRTLLIKSDGYQFFTRTSFNLPI